MKTWVERDLLVLRYLNEHPPEHAILWTNWRSEQSDKRLEELTEQDFHYAVETLADAGYVTYEKAERDGGGSVGWMGFQVSGSGKQILGDWPMFEGLGQPAGLSDVLTALAGYAESDEEETNLQKAAETAGQAGEESLRAIATGALAEVARGALGG